MASSDSDEFASADEAASTDGSERRRRSKRTSSSNYDSEEGAGGRQGISPAQPAAEKVKEPAIASLAPVKQADGWDDFDIEEEPTTQPTPPTMEQVVVPPVTALKKPTTSPTAKGVKEPVSSTVKSPDKSAGDGWDKFDDWGQDEPTTEQTAKPTQEREEDRLKSVADRLSGQAAPAGGGAWGWGWSVDSLLSTATAGITTLSSTVSQGISTVASALESGIGAPEPEELARRSLDTIDESGEQSEATPPATAREEKREAQDVKSSPGEGAFAFGNLMSGVSHITKFVENTGNKVITGGLDTLETIGKKTMEALQEGDPGLARTRALRPEPGRPVLSRVLREAKEQAEEEDRRREMKREAKEVHYETLFDDFEGLVHLEALEMLSRQVGMRIEDRLRGLQGDKKREMKETLQQVAELCEMPEEDEETSEPADGLSRSEALHGALREATQDLGLALQFQPLVKQCGDITAWLSTEATEERAVYKRAVSGLAQCTALAVEIYHKAAELLLVKARRSTADEADALTQMTSALVRHVGSLAADFAGALGRLATDDNRQQVDTYTTNIFLEAGNSSTYIQNAFHLTLPILQIGAA